MAINCQASERSYDSEEMKVESERCKALKSTIETLCTEKNTAFYSIFKKVGEEIDQKRKKSAAKRNLFQACYMYQTERLPALLERITKTLGTAYLPTGLL